MQTLMYCASLIQMQKFVIFESHVEYLFNFKATVLWIKSVMAFSLRGMFANWNNASSSLIAQKRNLEVTSEFYHLSQSSYPTSKNFVNRVNIYWPLYPEHWTYPLGSSSQLVDDWPQGDKRQGVCYLLLASSG